MTNYNERLDEILAKLENAVVQDTAQRMSGQGGKMSPKHHHTIAKQAITSLIKELVAEAKPDYCDGSEKCNCSTEMEQYINSGKETAIIQFEQNLLKALEEV